MKIQHGRDLTGYELAQIVDEFCNGAGNKEYAEFTEQVITRTHRTLQQKIMRLMVLTIEAWANALDYDARNEATVELARKIVKATGDKYDRFLPYI